MRRRRLRFNSTELLFERFKQVLKRDPNNESIDDDANAHWIQLLIELVKNFQLPPELDTVFLIASWEFSYLQYICEVQ